jgi:transitional endoplasmic reticulum ATPase
LNAMVAGGSATPLPELYSSVLNGSLQAMGKAKVDLTEKAGLPFRLDLVNCDYHDLPGLLEGLKKNPAARMLFSGVAGSGKSEYAKYIAEQLGVPLMVYRASDLLNPYVGQTEANTSEMFRKASTERGVLLVDEADSFLGSRKTAMQRFEIGMVNEMLTQLESYDGICVFTTNLKANLDEAVLRRFDLKVEFFPLTAAQSQTMLEVTCAHLGLQYDGLCVLPSGLNLGDYAVVQRQHRFNPVKDVAELVCRLISELEHREPKKCGMGFLVAA